MKKIILALAALILFPALLPAQAIGSLPHFPVVCCRFCHRFTGSLASGLQEALPERGEDAGGDAGSGQDLLIYGI